jgi:hypothetical protein
MLLGFGDGFAVTRRGNGKGAGAAHTSWLAPDRREPGI